MSRTIFVALLRGINVGGHNKIPMAELRLLCAEMGMGDVQTYIQSGNLVFSSAKPAAALENALEQSIERRFGHKISVIVRRAGDWAVYVESNPFPEIGKREPNLLALGLAKAALNSQAIKGLRERAANGEQLAQTGEALWVHFPKGVATSKLSPNLMARLVGSPVTLRNWRTVLRLQGMAQQLSE